MPQQTFLNNFNKRITNPRHILYMKNKNNTLPKVAIISDERFPHHATNTQQVIKNADALHRLGLPVEMLIPIQAKGLFNPKYKVVEAIYKYYNIERGLKFIQIPTIPASDLRIEKFTHFLAAPFYTLFKKYDIIYTRNELAAVLCFWMGKKIIFETYRRLGVEYPNAIQRISKWAQKDNFLGIITHSHLSANSMIEQGMPAEKMLVLHNGFDQSDMEPVLSKQEARQKLNLPKKDTLVVYTGNMQKNKGMESLVDIAALCPKHTFVMVGGTPADLVRLRAYAEEKSAENLIWTGRVDIKLVSQYLYAGDCLIIPPISAPLQKFGRTVLPFKVFPYLASGRPTLAPATPDIKELMFHKENAILVEPDNIEVAAKELNELLADLEFCEKLGEAAKKSGEALTWDARAQKMIDWIQKIG